MDNGQRKTHSIMFKGCSRLPLLFGSNHQTFIPNISILHQIPGNMLPRAVVKAQSHSDNTDGLDISLGTLELPSSPEDPIRYHDTAVRYVLPLKGECTALFKRKSS